ncbi:ABC transporter ATP-binding protein [Nocardioides antri]|uniref:ATP-binding cassette domain-containing protein n=1 Tax=Nocardioides antri TaxID=2607659 RepID=A0A5B1M1N3_9ACTN|nr:ATP-binding cassette domain-containing protein [Nocardioides antri]KAA1426009.1 ATP-binding cassette domain-containing protein [Nocardioides antri]
MSDLVVSDLTVEFDSGGYPIRPLNHLSMSAADGELVVLLGPSGCGKTTLLSCLAGLLTPTAGSITLGDTDLLGMGPKELAEYRRRHVGVVFQAFNLVPSLTALGNVVAPMTLAGLRRPEAHRRATELLTSVGLAERMNHRPSKMSGGQQQRVAIARALVHEPRLVLADEPTAHLDHIQVEGVLRLIRELAQPGRMVVVATHDDRITHIADRVVELVPSGSVAEREPEDVVLADGEVLFRQGDPGDLVYVVKSGYVEIYRELSDGREEQVDVMGPGRYFGELAPLLRLPRSASVRAAGDAVVTGYTLRRFRRDHPSLSLAKS